MTSTLRHCEERQRRGNPVTVLWIAMLVLTLTSLSFSAIAQETSEETQKNLDDILTEATIKEGTVRVAPEDCDFEVTFPGKTYTAKRCPDGPTSCYNLTGYTMVYDVTTTIEVTMTCVPSTPTKYKKYTEPVIAAALKGMIGRAEVSEHEINTLEEKSEDGDMRQGSLLGSAKRGKQNSIYNAQLWVGQNSVMTMEAKLIGPFHAEADTIFSEILSSIKKQDN